MERRGREILAAVALFAAGTVISGCNKVDESTGKPKGSAAEHKQSSQANLTFKEVACRGFDKGAPPRTAKSAWDGDVLTLRAPVCLNCAETVQDVTAKIEADSIVLAVTASRPKEIAKCDCERNIDIRIQSLPKRDYAIRGIPPVEECI